jgi:hypothetical protein
MLFQNARTRVAVLEIMKDDLVSMALHDPMDSRRANETAWAQMAGVIMRFSTNPNTRPFHPPSGLSPRQRAIWLVYAYSQMPTGSHASVAMALNVAVNSYAEQLNETAILHKAQTTVDRLMKQDK